MTDARTIHAAVVHTSDGVRFFAAESSAAGLTASLAEYVETNAADQLWPDDAERVKHLIGQDMLLDAIEVYFACVGERWDVERVHYASRVVAEHSSFSPITAGDARE